MSDEEDNNENEEITRLEQEVEAWKAKYKQLELKKRESDLSLNKIKTEINSLRSMDKLWKEACKTIFTNLRDVKQSFEMQIEQILDGMAEIGKVEERIGNRMLLLKKVQKVIFMLQRRIAKQDETIMALNGKIRVLTVELADKTAKVERLSQGIEEEVERLIKPMRDKLSEAMTMVMKEKAGRAQERRELADLWPSDHMMPTLLMRYRALNDEERARRVEVAKQQDASLALTLEVQANVTESKMWEVKYDDYGRQYFQHMKTGETRDEAPEIMSYKPPPGRDESGNIVTTEDNDSSNWLLLTDNRGQVYFRHKLTNVVTYIPPYAYQAIPAGKTPEQIVSEAANVVLGYIKGKIAKHIAIKSKRKQELESPLTFEEQKKKDKADRNRTAEEIAAAGPELTEEGEPIELSSYHYDIETVEMLASHFSDDKKRGDADPEQERKEQRAFLEGEEVRKFDEQLHAGKLLKQIDPNELTITNLRGVVEDLAQMEEKLEKQLNRARANLKEYAYLLQEKVNSEEEAKFNKYKEERLEQEKQARLERKRLRFERIQKANEARAAKEAARAQAELEAKESKDVQGLKDSGTLTKEDDDETELSKGSKGSKASPDVGDIKGEDDSMIGGESIVSGEASLESKMEDAPKGDASVASAVTSVTKEALLPIDDEEEEGKQEEQEAIAKSEQEEMEEPEEIEEPEDELSDDTLKFELYGDPVARLFGELNIEDLETDFSIALKNLAKRLSNFALFCGYNNLNATKFTLDSNENYSLLDTVSDESVGGIADNETVKDILSKSGAKSVVISKSGVHSASTESKGDADRDQQDDDWLSSQFFVGCQKSELSKHNELLKKTYDANVGMLMIGPMNPEIIVYQSNIVGEVHRIADKAYTPLTRIARESPLYEQYLEWKNAQLLADIVRSQLQQYAINHVVDKRLQAFSQLNPTAKKTVHLKETLPVVILTLSDIKFQLDIPLSSICSTESYLQFSLGSWSTKTPPQYFSQYGIKWEGFEIQASLSVNDIQLHDLKLEVIDVNPETMENTIFVTGKGCLHNSVGAHYGKIISYDIPMVGPKGKEQKGSISFSAVATLEFKDLEHLPDPYEKNRLEVLATAGLLDSVPISTNHNNNDSNAYITGNNYCNPLEEKRFRELVSDLRGDHSNKGAQEISIARLLTGDYSISKLLQSQSHQRMVAPVKPLPNFRKAEMFLEKKFSIHNAQMKVFQKKMKERLQLLLELLKSKADYTQKQYNDAKGKYKKLFDQSEDAKNDVLRVLKNVNDFRKPHPPPKEPEFPDFPPVPHVPELPQSGGLDSRGKKKKALSTADLKTLMDGIEQGEHDGKEDLPFPENLFPSQAQMLKIAKVIQQRNTILDAKRAQEVSVRDQAMQFYENEKVRWEGMEKKRLSDLEKAKKECRKVNLKYDCLMARLNRFEEECKGIEIDIKSVQDLKTLHEKCSENFKMFRIKSEMEKERQQKYITSLKIRMLRAINARRYVLDFPSTATDAKQFEQLKEQAEEALGYLKMEIFECKMLLQQEGLRLRHHWYEEEAICSNELTRMNVSIEILQQKDCFDQVMSKYKVEMMQLLVEIEKHKLLEADKDEIGLETVDDLGERFILEKNWTSPNVIKCQRMIDLLLAKVQITEGYNRSTNQSQRHLVDVLFKQSVESTGFFVKDTWIQISDYERSQQLAKDTMQYLSNARSLLQNLNNENYQLPLLQYQLAMKLREDQMKTHHILHEKETKNVKQSSELILESARKHLATYREETEKKLLHLEKSIIDLSRECQKVREELLQQQMVNDEKVKVLWAFIHTLQTALQQLSAKMEIVIEERDRVVIESKLMADNTRHQLRIERKHCANLLFMIHSQRGMIHYLKDVIKKVNRESKQLAKQQKFEKYQLRKELWETVFTFTRLCTDVDLLFEFFATRIANLAGSRAALNDQLAYHNAALVLAALCKNPKPIIRRSAARALGNMGWNGFVETRILLWDCIMYWKMVKSKVITRDCKDFHETLEKFNETGQYDAVINLKSEIEEFVPTGNLSLRSIIKQRRQWALRAARRMEGPNVSNQKLLNIRDGVLISLLQLCVDSDPVLSSAEVEEKELNLSAALSTDWEIARNAALAISIASYEPTNHKEMVHHPLVLKMIMQMCNLNDAEIQTHAAVTIANLSYKDEEAQRIFGQKSIEQVGTDKVEGYRTHSGGIIPKLLDMLTGPIADVLEASTAALANLTCYCDSNCETVFKYDGLPKIMKVITQSYSENLLDLDQNDEVHANASEVLANISRFNTKDSIKYFTSEVIDNLVIMCASPNKQLRRHISLVLGNIGQSERCREEIGMKGGIEALFLTLEDTDTIIQANSLWALSNLMWHPPNQERAGRFIKEIIVLLQSPYEPVMINACILLGNVVYYNTPNRVRFLDIDGAFELLISYIRSHYPPDHPKFQYPIPVLEACLRSMLSLSYLDSIAMWLGEEGKCIPVFIYFLHAPFISREVMRYSLEIICNLCLHHANRRIIYEEQGIEAIVPLHSDPDAYVRDLSVQVIEHLEDITPAEVLARARSIVGLERMVTLASNDDPLVRAVAAEAIGEEIWMDPSKQSRAQEIGAIDSLLGIVNNPDERLESLLPAVWSLRNLLHNHAAAQAQFGYRDGVKAVAQVIRRALTGVFFEQAEKVFEACVACLISAINKEPRNSRRLVMIGLDAIIEISEESSFLKKQTGTLFSHGQTSPQLSPAIQHIIAGIKNEGVQALVNSLLLLLAPYNYVVCKNCGRKQDLHGTSCYFCGHRLLVDVDIDRIPGATNQGDTLSPVKLRQSQSANSFNPPPWRHAGKATDTAIHNGQDDGNGPYGHMNGRPTSPSRMNAIGGAMGGMGAGVVSSNYAGKEDKKSYFSRTLPVKSTTSAGQLPVGDGIASNFRPKSATSKH